MDIVKYQASNITEVDGRDFVQEFINYADVKPRSLRNYRQGISKMLAHFRAEGFGLVSQWATVSPKVLRQTFINFRAELEKTLAPSTAQLYIVGARRFVGWLAFEGVCSNFADRVKGVSVSIGHKRDSISETQGRSLILSFDASTEIGARNQAIAALMLSTGLRCVEVSRSDISDIEQKSGRWFLRVHGKKRSGKDEVVGLPASVKSLIDKYLALRGGIDQAQPLFVSCSHRNKGGRLSPTSISVMLKAALRSIGLDSRRITAHSLRHTFVTQALLKGVAEKDVIQACRHRSANVLSVYRHDMSRADNTAEDTVAAGLFEGLFA